MIIYRRKELVQGVVFRPPELDRALHGEALEGRCVSWGGGREMDGDLSGRAKADKLGLAKHRQVSLVVTGKSTMDVLQREENVSPRWRVLNQE